MIFSVELFAALTAHAPSANVVNLELYNSGPVDV